MTAIRGYYENVKNLDPYVHLYYESVRPYVRFGWVIPLDDHRANIGYSTSLNAIQHQPLQRYFSDFIGPSSRIYRQIQHARCIAKPRGCFLALGKIPLHCATDKVLFLGDAAGFIDPLTGEGIANALTSAKIAVELIHEHFIAPNYLRQDGLYETSEIAKSYVDRCQQSFGEEFAAAMRVYMSK